MRISRRQLIVLSGAVVCGCAPGGAEPPESPAISRGPVDGGPIAALGAQPIDERFRDRGFYLVREGIRVFAQASICTHRACKLKTRAAGFLCPCHGSTFNLGGHVTRGPAQRDLPRFRIEIDAKAHLIVHTDQPIPPEQFDSPGAFVHLR